MEAKREILRKDLDNLQQQNEILLKQNLLSSTFDIQFHPLTSDIPEDKGIIDQINALKEKIVHSADN